jgi:hypothetical protein
MCAPSSISGQSAATIIDIGKDEIAPSEFDLSQGRWTVVRDATAKAGLALEQSGVPPAEDRFPLAIYKPASLKNAEISLRLKGDSVTRFDQLEIVPLP